jgi:nitrite reductase/ring-hydroxylating ferredoxin subunit
MLSAEDNDVLARVGVGTPMGNLFRRFWLPALLEEEVAQPDGPPVRLRLLGEDLVAFKDTSGKIGIVDAYCSHRRAGLYFGRNEECGLRCVYHGWKFDVDGNCVDVPSEPRDARQLQQLRIKAYPTKVQGGVVWVYMGPQNNAEIPNFEWSRVPRSKSTVTKRLQRTNWAQAVEGGIDSAHVSFLHHHNKKVQNPFGFQDSAEVWKYLEQDTHPVFSVDDVDSGLLIYARRNAGADSYYWRVTHFLLPCYTLTPPTVDPATTMTAPYYGHAWVPIDDYNCWTWSFHASPYADYSDAEREFQAGANGIWGPVDESYHPIFSLANDFGLDRERQRKDNYTGIEGIQNQDAAIQESMGPIVDRTGEHLGRTDLAVVRFRRQMLRLARELTQGREPVAASQGRLYDVRPATVVLPIGETVSRKFFRTRDRLEAVPAE